MLDTYVQMVVFAFLAAFLPLSMLAFSKLVRPRNVGNEVQKLPYESAEESVGQRVDIMREYLHYFPLFLAFEVIGIVVIIWSTFPKQGMSSSGAYVIPLLVFGLAFELIILGIIKKKGE
jgi:NADH:ubiquinone oxidoreductase subunit 3 (subunit A)